MATPIGWLPGGGTLLALIAAVILGCTLIRTRTMEKGDVTMTQEQFAAHFEHVFRYHNRVMNDLINYSADLPEDSNDSRPIGEAEATMIEACEPLNDVVAAESVSEHVGFRTKRRLPQAVPECEVATRHLEVLLREVFKTKEISTHFVAQ